MRLFHGSLFYKLIVNSGYMITPFKLSIMQQTVKMFCQAGLAEFLLQKSIDVLPLQPPKQLLFQQVLYGPNLIIRTDIPRLFSSSKARHALEKMRPYVTITCSADSSP